MALIVVVGAGVAGLVCAVTLAEAGQAVLVLEARAEPGGRVRSLRRDGRVVGELGPSWLWPRHQPIVADWLERLGVATAAQFDAFVCSRADREGPSAHPAVLPAAVRAAAFEGRLHFAGAETARISPGLLEGALEAGARASQALLA